MSWQAAFCKHARLTLAAIPPTNMRLGMTVPYFGAWVLLRGVEEGVADGETSADEDFNKKHENSLKLWCSNIKQLPYFLLIIKWRLSFEIKDVTSCFKDPPSPLTSVRSSTSQLTCTRFWGDNRYSEKHNFSPRTLTISSATLIEMPVISLSLWIFSDPIISDMLPVNNTFFYCQKNGT